MEENTLDPILDIHLDYDGGNILRETVRWSRFLSVVGIVCLSIFIFCLALAGSRIIAMLDTAYPGVESVAGLILILLVLILGVAGALVFMLYRFSVLTRQGIESQDQVVFNRGLRGLKIYFLISGILAILTFIFNLLTLTSLF